MRKFLAVCLASLMTALLAANSRAEPISADQIIVVSGDTIRLKSQSADTRLMGFKSPEAKRKTCENERQLGGKATRLLRELVAGTDLDFQFVKCACRAGTEGTPRCNQSRSCGILKSNDQDVSEILIDEGLAARFSCGVDRCPAQPQPWCVAQQRRPKKPIGINLQTFSELNPSAARLPDRSVPAP